MTCDGSCSSRRKLSCRLFASSDFITRTIDFMYFFGFYTLHDLYLYSVFSMGRVAETNKGWLIDWLERDCLLLGRKQCLVFGLLWWMVPEYVTLLSLWKRGWADRGPACVGDFRRCKYCIRPLSRLMKRTLYLASSAQIRCGLRQIRANVAANYFCWSMLMMSCNQRVITVTSKKAETVSTGDF